MSQITASVVEPQNLPVVWDDVAELLEPACDRSHGQETIQTLRASLMRGSEGLFIVKDGDDIIGAVTFQTTDYDTGLRLLDINYAGGVAMGTQMPAVIDMFNTLKSAFMCDRVRITGRKGWVRYMKQFGFKTAHYSVEME
jgi:hypothetical protein